MVQVQLYGTTGTFPSLAKNGADSKYIFFPEPTSIRYSYKKQVETEDIPFMSLPIAYDPYTQTRTITMTGTLMPTLAAEPPGAKTLKVRHEDLDKLTNYLATFSNQPNPSSADVEVYCLEVTYPDGTAKQHFVNIVSLNITWAGGFTKQDYTVVFKEIQDVILM